MELKHRGKKGKFPVSLALRAMSNLSLRMFYKSCPQLKIKLMPHSGTARIPSAELAPCSVGNESGDGSTTDLPALPRSEAQGTRGEPEMTLPILKALSSSVYSW